MNKYDKQNAMAEQIKQNKLMEIINEVKQEES